MSADRPRVCRHGVYLNERQCRRCHDSETIVHCHATITELRLRNVELRTRIDAALAECREIETWGAQFIGQDPTEEARLRVAERIREILEGPR